MKLHRHVRAMTALVVLGLVAAGCGCAVATPQDQATAQAFTNFASSPSDATFAALPLASRVQLGVGDRILTTKSRSSLRSPTAWDVDYGGIYHASTGEYNVLDFGESLASERKLDCFAESDAFRADTPSELRGLHRICLRPTEGTLLNFPMVDLFVENDEIQAIIIDHPEP